MNQTKSCIQIQRAVTEIGSKLTIAITCCLNALKNKSIDVGD